MVDRNDRRPASRRAALGFLQLPPRAPALWLCLHPRERHFAAAVSMVRRCRQIGSILLS